MDFSYRPNNLQIASTGAAPAMTVGRTIAMRASGDTGLW